VKLVWWTLGRWAAAQQPEDPQPGEPEEAEEDKDLEEELARQQAEIDELRAQLAETRLSLIPKDTLKVDFEGHYRVRGHLFNHLWAAQGTGDSYRDARYLNQRLWLRPRFDYRGLAKLFVEFRALEDVTFGDNASLSSTALFAGDPSDTDLEGQTIPSVTLGRVWSEVTVPVGLIRFGRMPSDWGMGLLVGPGDGFGQPFGEAYYPSTNDRILFATRPLAILAAIRGKEDRDIPLYVVVAVDRLVEDPLFQYYGYSCSPGVTEAEDDFDPRCDSDSDGVTDLDHSYQDDEVQESSRGLDWWADQNDDVMQMVYVVTYRGQGVSYLGGRGDLSVGVWAVNRTQRETDSHVWIVDGYLKSFVHRVLLETEWVAIQGQTRALPLPDATQEDPLQKTASILGYAVKGAYVLDALELRVETGFASGDNNVADETFTVRSLHPDHNVGLLLYETVLAQVTASQRTTSARGLWSNGGVYSSRYVFPTLHVRPLDNWEIIGGFVAAWPDAPDGAIIRCKSSDDVDCATPASLQPEADMLGYEIDLAIKHRWHEHVLFSLEGGMAHATDRLPLESAGLNPEGNFFTVQSRLAWQF
jgi:hypothetical protein